MALSETDFINIKEKMNKINQRIDTHYVTLNSIKEYKIRQRQQGKMIKKMIK